MSELWVPDKYRAEVSKDVKPFFAPVQGAPAFAPAVQSAQAEIARQGAISSNPFAPGLPLQPYEGVGGVPRGWNFPTGYNIKARADRDGRLSFETLKKLTDTYEVARLCIQHRIDDVRSLDWTVVPAEGTDRNMGDVIALAKRYLKKPDGRTPFRNWLAMYLEDVLRYDAGTLSKRRNRAGRVIGLDVVQGSTIAPVVDYWGRPPTGDAPAFVQFVNGLPWKWFTSDQLIYSPFRPQPDSMYGFAPIEGAMMSANTHLRFQQHWLEWFTQGTIPDGFGILPENVGTSPDDRDRWQKAWDALYAGDSAMKSQIKWMPFGTSFEWPKDHTFDEAFPTFLMRIVCAVYSVTPNDIGFTMDVNRANGETQVDVQFRVGTRPLLKHIEDILTDWLQDDMGLPVVFQFDEGGEKEDREATAKAWEIGIRNGAVSPDEMRVDVFGKEVDDSRPTPRYIYTNTQGPIPLRSLLDVAGPVDPDTTAPSEDEPLGTQPFAGTPGVLPHKSPGSPQFARAPIDPDDPAHPSNEGVVPGSGIVSQPAPAAAPEPTQKAADVIKGELVDDAYDLSQDELKALSTWRHSARSSVKLGKLPRKFKDSGLPEHVEAEVWKGLRGARTREQVDGAFAPVITKAAGDSPDPKGWRASPPNPEPQHALDLSLTDYYRPEVQQGLEGLWSDAALGQFTESVAGSGSRERAMIRALVDMSFGAALNDDDLHAALTRLWSDAYRSGALAASKQLGMDVASEWDKWKPGLDAGQVTNDGGWLQATGDAGITLKGITDESLHMVASAIERGVIAGSTVDEIARNIRGAVGSADRAELIAHTETARMLTRSSVDQYRAAGVTQFDLVTSAGACAKLCLPAAATNPHPMGDAAAMVPLHPRCRCAVSPHTDR